MTETKDHISKIAFRLFLLKNFKEVTMQDIVKETGLSKGAFYHYFKSKEEVFEEVVNKYYLAEEFNSYDHFDQSSLQHFCRDYLAHTHLFIQHIISAVEINGAVPETLNYFNLLFDALNRLPDFREKTLQMQLAELARWQQVVEHAQASGEIRPEVASRAIAQLFLYTVDSTFIHCIMEGDFRKGETELKFLWDNLYQLLRA
jgi:TetR/AcrR family transcriptional regulator, transcriptional repressor for nem operon